MHILTVFCKVLAWLLFYLRYMGLRISSSFLSSSLMAPQFIAEPCLLNELLPVICVFDLSLQFPILHLLMSVCTQFHHLLFGHPVSWFLWGLLLNTYFSFTVHSINMTNPIQLTYSDKWKKSTSPNSCINPHYIAFSIFIYSNAPKHSP